MIKYCPSCGYDLSSLSVSQVEIPENRLQEPVRMSTEEVSILNDYSVQPETVKGVEVAVPTKLDNRKRLLDLARRPLPVLKMKRMDGEMDQFGDLVVGSGIQQEL